MAAIESLVSAAAAALISAGAAAAMAAARRSGETRDAVLRLSGRFEALDARLATHMADVRSQHGAIDRHVEHLDQRLRSLEAGWVERRRRPPAAAEGDLDR